jgi:hypothetical protein
VEDNQKTIRRLVRTIAIGVLLFPAAGIPQDDPVSKIDRCRQVAAAEPNTGAAVYRSGLCFESIRDLGDAANAYSRALELAVPVRDGDRAESEYFSSDRPI